MTIISFIFVGLFINLLQLLLVCTIRLSDNKKWRLMHKKLDGNLIYLLYTQPIFIAYFWSNMKVKIVLNDVSIIEDVKKPLLAILLPNHTYELDWLTCFVLADQLGNIGSYKCFSKDELKYLPIIGWSFWMSDLIYVKRNWQQDKLNIDKKLDELLTYEQILLGIFAEGTRFTPERYELAKEFMTTRNIEPYKYHLYPRSRGFAYTLGHYLYSSRVLNKFDEKLLRLFNMQIMMPDRPGFRDFLAGKQLIADVYCEEVSLSREFRDQMIEHHSREVKNSSETNFRSSEEAVKLMENIYRRKDQLVDEYQANGNKFAVDESAGGGYFPYKRPVRPFMYWLTFMSFTYGSLTYLALVIFAESVTFWSLLVVFMSSGLLMLRRISRESKPRRDLAFGKPIESVRLTKTNIDETTVASKVQDSVIFKASESTAA